MREPANFLPAYVASGPPYIARAVAYALADRSDWAVWHLAEICARFWPSVDDAKQRIAAADEKDGRSRPAAEVEERARELVDRSHAAVADVYKVAQHFDLEVICPYPPRPRT